MLYDIVSWNKKQLDVNYSSPSIVIENVTFQDMVYMESTTSGHNLMIRITGEGGGGGDYRDGLYKAEFIGDAGMRQALLVVHTEWMGYPLIKYSVSIEKGCGGGDVVDIHAPPHPLYSNMCIITRTKNNTAPPSEECKKLNEGEGVFGFRKKYNINFDLV